MRLRSPAFTPTGLEGLGLGPTNGLPGRYFIQTRHYVSFREFSRRFTSAASCLRGERWPLSSAMGMDKKR